MQRLVLVAAAALVLSLGAKVARADGAWDINLARLCQIRAGNDNDLLNCGGGATSSVLAAALSKAAAGSTYSVVADNAAFRSLMSELGAVFAPNILSPSDTQGYSGFNFAAEFGWTSVNRLGQNRDSNNYYWRAAESVSGTTFADPRSVDLGRLQKELPSSFAPTVTVMARKGFWMPIPSFEIGVGVRHLIGSSMFAPLVSAKLALHEGFHGWPVPSLAVRGMGARVLGTNGFNLTVAGLDFSVSKHIGVASSFNLTPYMGYQLLWIIADSEVLDATPGIDAFAEGSRGISDPKQLTQCRHMDCAGSFTFQSQSNITRHRLFLGLRANFYIASLLLEYTFFAGGGTADQIATSAGIPLTIPDDSKSQHTVSFAIALDY